MLGQHKGYRVRDVPSMVDLILTLPFHYSILGMQYHHASVVST